MHPYTIMNKERLSGMALPKRTPASDKAKAKAMEKLGPLLGLGRKKPEPKKPTFRPLMGDQDHA